MITILTPTYNRGYILHKAYESLCRQTSHEFEWIVIDDGSTDDTGKTVSEWKNKEYLFPIIYYKQRNGGKHRAINKGASVATADYILILDSDDYLSDDAVITIHDWIKSIDGLPNFAGVAGLRGWYTHNGAVGGKAEDGNYIDATNLERKKFGLLGDKAEIYKTSILREYPFPEFENENFLRESASWDRIAKDGYKIRWFNKVIYKCEYLEDGLTKNSDIDLYAKNFQGYTYCCKLYLKTHAFPYTSLKIGHYSQVAKKAGKRKYETCVLLNINDFRLITGKLIYKANNALKSALSKR